MTPSSSNVRWWGVVLELHWLGNLAFLRRPPASTHSKTSLLSMLDSGMFSHLRRSWMNPSNTAKSAQTLTRWVGRYEKNFFQPFHEVSKIRAILHFDNNNRVATGHLIGSSMNNELELNGKQSTGPCSDWIKWQLETRDERQWMAFPRKYIEENGANNTAQHYGTTTKRELWKFYWKIKHSLNMRTIARLHAIAWALTKYLCQFFLFGVRPIQTITFNSGFMYVLSYKNS